MGTFRSPQPTSMHQKSKRRILSAPLLEERPVQERGRQTGNDQEERRLSNALEGHEGRSDGPSQGLGECPEPRVGGQIGLCVG